MKITITSTYPALQLHLLREISPEVGSHTRVQHVTPRSSALIGNNWPLPQLPRGMSIHLFCSSALGSLAQKSGILVICIFHQTRKWQVFLAKDQEFCWMRMQPPFSGRLPDFQKGAELTAGSSLQWRPVLFISPVMKHFT